MDNELEAHAPARSDAIAIKEFQWIFGAGDGHAGIGQLVRFGGATIVTGTADRNSDHIVGTRRERSRIKKAGRDLIVERYGRAVCLDDVEENRQALDRRPATLLSRSVVALRIISACPRDLLDTLDVKAISPPCAKAASQSVRRDGRSRRGAHPDRRPCRPKIRLDSALAAHWDRISENILARHAP